MTKIDTRSFTYLETMLRARHGKNVNDVLTTDYAAIPGLKLKASDTNGTSGIGVYYGRRVYWHYNYPQATFIVERA